MGRIMSRSISLRARILISTPLELWRATTGIKQTLTVKTSISRLGWSFGEAQRHSCWALWTIIKNRK
jgi:hypothetical protein